MQESPSLKYSLFFAKLQIDPNRISVGAQVIANRWESTSEIDCAYSKWFVVCEIDLNLISIALIKWLFRPQIDAMRREFRTGSLVTDFFLQRERKALINLAETKPYLLGVFCVPLATLMGKPHAPAASKSPLLASSPTVM